MKLESVSSLWTFLAELNRLSQNPRNNGTELGGEPGAGGGTPAEHRQHETTEGGTTTLLPLALQQLQSSNSHLQ